MTQVLAECYRFRNRPREAAAHYERALAFSARLPGGVDVSVLPSLSGLAILAEREGSPGSAARLHARALDLAQGRLTRRDPARAVFVARAAAFYARSGDPGRAESLYAEASAIVDGCRTACPLQRAAVLEGLAAFYVSQGRARDASRVRGALVAQGESAAQGRAALTIPPGWEASQAVPLVFGR